jgi:hypothetical protein
MAFLSEIISGSCFKSPTNTPFKRRQKVLYCLLDMASLRPSIALKDVQGSSIAIALKFLLG